MKSCKFPSAADSLSSDGKVDFIMRTLVDSLNILQMAWGH